MAKKIKTPITITSIELSYVTPETKGRSNYDEDHVKVKSMHLDDSARKILGSTIRCNFRAKLSTKNVTITEINSNITALTQDYETLLATDLCRRLQNFIVQNTEIVFPDLKRTNPEIVEIDWTEKLKGDKNSLIYDTILYRFIDKNIDEKDILKFLQEIVSKKLEKYFSVNAHFNCWGYYLNQQPMMASPLQTFIDHRISQLKK